MRTPVDAIVITCLIADGRVAKQNSGSHQAHTARPSTSGGCADGMTQSAKRGSTF